MCSSILAKNVRHIQIQAPFEFQIAYNTIVKMHGLIINQLT